METILPGALTPAWNQRGDPLPAPPDDSTPAVAHLHDLALPQAPALPQEAAQRVAWFDLNGDGRIDQRPTMLGGDAFLPGDPRFGRSGASVTAEHRPLPEGSRLSTPAEVPVTMRPVANHVPEATATRQATAAYARYGDVVAPAKVAGGAVRTHE